MQVVWEFFTKLWKPFADSVAGKVSWKEALMAAVLGVLYFISEGQLSDLMTQVLGSIDITNIDARKILGALIVFLLSWLTRKWQGTPVKF